MTFDPNKDAVAKSADDATVAQSVVPVESRTPVLAYATPTGDSQRVCRSALDIIIGHDTDLPDRCVKCNGTTDRRIVVIPTLAPDASNSQRRTSPLHIGLCRWHAITSRVRKFAVYALVAFIASPVLFVFLLGTGILDRVLNRAARGGAPNNQTITLVLGSCFAFIFTVCFLGLWRLYRNSAPLALVKYTTTSVWMRGAGYKFRHSLPPLMPEEERVAAWARSAGRAIRHTVRPGKVGES